jgi:hypothetical protein
MKGASLMDWIISYGCYHVCYGLSYWLKNGRMIRQVAYYVLELGATVDAVRDIALGLESLLIGLL